VKSWRARLEQAAVSARELPAAGAPARAAEEAVKVAPEVEVKRAAAVVAVNDLLNERLGTHKWRREDELEWRRAAIDLSPEQYRRAPLQAHQRHQRERAGRVRSGRHALAVTQPRRRQTDKAGAMSNQARAALAAIIGEDPVLRAVLTRAALVAPTTMPVLVTGESGTGKELLARALHELGPAPTGPFVAVNCGALPRELAESELFGHERGAFTGAAGRRSGWFEEASGGTLVLDEVGELPLELQPKLLRVLETGRLRRVGGTGEQAVRVRVVAMTLRDLEAEVRRRTFREDLYYRLAGFHLTLPALRERRDDVPLLAHHFLRELEGEVGPRRLEPSALVALRAARWTGNVRELRNVLRRAAILTRDVIGETDLELRGIEPFRLGEEPAPPMPVVPRPPVEGDSLSLSGRTFEQIEREVLAWALRRNAGSRRRAARSLDMARSTFCDKVKRYGIGEAGASTDTTTTTTTTTST
jgi:transcriptional regulator with GAF, ATPase, and Fis domain